MTEALAEEMPPAASSAPTTPEPTEAAVGGEVGAVPTWTSAMNQGRRTERLISQIILLELLEELRQMGTSAFYREAFLALIRSVNSLVAMWEVINQGETILCEAQQKAAEARARAERAKKAMEASGHRATAEAKRARAALDQLGEAIEAVTTQDFRIDALATEIKAAKERAEKAKEAERRSDSLIAEGETKVREMKTATAAAEERAAKAEKRAVEAMDNFRKSTSFADELAEASADVYLQGFRDYREKVARVLGLPGAIEIEPDEVSEGAPSEGEPVAADP